MIYDIIFEWIFINGKKQEYNKIGKFIFERKNKYWKKWNGIGKKLINNKYYEIIDEKGRVNESNYFGFIFMKVDILKEKKMGRKRILSKKAFIWNKKWKRRRSITYWLWWYIRIWMKCKYIKWRKNRDGEDIVMKSKKEFLNDVKCGKGKEYYNLYNKKN